MPDNRSNDYLTVTVLSSKAVARQGSTGLVLVTQELGAIAFEVDQRAIDALRKSLTNAETFLRQTPGSA